MSFYFWPLAAPVIPWRLLLCIPILMYVKHCSLSFSYLGRHDCVTLNHMCPIKCELQSLRHCDMRCKEQIDHQEPKTHLCEAIHLCAESCESLSCNQICATRYDSDVYNEGNHRHDCGHETCSADCDRVTRRTCGRKCSSGHFHEGSSKVTWFIVFMIDRVCGIGEHLCSNGHACSNHCEIDGTCSFSVLVWQFCGFQKHFLSFWWCRWNRKNHRHIAAYPVR